MCAACVTLDCPGTYTAHTADVYYRQFVHVVQEREWPRMCTRMDGRPPPAYFLAYHRECVPIYARAERESVQCILHFSMLRYRISRCSMCGAAHALLCLSRAS